MRGLFANVPARLKFLKSIRTETGYVSDYVSRMIMAVPSVSFHLLNNGRTVYQSYGDGQLKNALLCVYGASVLSNLREVAFDDGYLSIAGFAGTEALARPNRLQQSFFLNGRYIRSYALSAALQRAYDTRLMTGRFPFAVLALRIAGGEVDVNVHPDKARGALCGRAARGALRHGGVPPRAAGRARCRRRRRDGGGAGTPGSAAVLPPLPELRAPQAPAARPIREAAPYSPAPRSFSFRLPQQPDVPQARPMQAQEPQTVSAPPDAPPRAEQLRLADAPYRVIGVAFLAYWIVQQGEALFLIDQHAAHERRLYEQLMRRTVQPVAQPLLSPLPVVMSPLELQTLEQNREALEALGFSFDFGADGVLLLTGVPPGAGRAADGTLFARRT